MDNHLIQIKNLSFAYPGQSKRTLNNIWLTMDRGEFTVLCGPSGCGKSTLLRQLRTAMAPSGETSGEIFIDGRALSDMDQREQTEYIGFVQQSPENQIVTDKVWHELAFTLESLGYGNDVIRRRVAEMAQFFGIDEWFYKSVEELSGGQKQLLNLAAVMTTSPDILILDEPTGQLDPIAASEFMDVLSKINRELGTSILLTEQRLEEALPRADRVYVMDEGGIICSGEVREVGNYLRKNNSTMFKAMTIPMRVWAETSDSGNCCPVTVSEGRKWLRDYGEKHTLIQVGAEIHNEHPDTEAPVLRGDGLWFRYEKDSNDIVRGLDIKLYSGEFVAILGGNGSGKSTLLRLLGGLLKPVRGKVYCEKKVVTLPQNPKMLFIKKTVIEDLQDICMNQMDLYPNCKLKADKSINDPSIRDLEKVIDACHLEHLLERHPFDLSGGEMQRLALAKVLLTHPDILLLDEPTKGLDAGFKDEFAHIIEGLIHEGKTVLMVSHDVEFCAEHTYRCLLYFDGNIACEGTPREFFAGNSFYTTASNRMSRGMLQSAVTASDLIRACNGGGNGISEKDSIQECRYGEAKSGNITLVQDKLRAMNQPKSLPKWKKTVIWICGIVAAVVMVIAMSMSSLNSIIEGNKPSALSGKYAALYALLIIALVIIAVMLGGNGNKEIDVKVGKSNDGARKPNKRTMVAAILVILMIPLTIFAGFRLFGNRKYYITTLAVLLECMLPFFIVFEGRKPKARELVIIAVLAAIGAVGRIAFGMLPSFNPVLAVTIISGIALGPETGFLVGAMTMVVSNFVFSQGPWTPWQMFAMGIVGFIAALIFRSGLIKRTKASTCIVGALEAIVIYGGIMNPAAAIIWQGYIYREMLMAYYLTGFPVDLVNAVATSIFLWIGAESLIEKLERVKDKYGLI